jgi:signal peptidase
MRVFNWFIKFSKVILLVFFVSLSFVVILLNAVWFGWRGQIILSGSMQPSITAGSLILTKRLPQKDYQVGDVVTFFSRDRQKGLVTHRIIGLKNNQQGIPVMETKGDANTNGDPWQIGLGNIVGKEMVSIPYLGYLLSPVGTRLGFSVLAPLFFFIFVYPELIWWVEVVKKRLNNQPSILSG